MNLSEMEKRQENQEDDPFTARSYLHAQSKSMRIAGR